MIVTRCNRGLDDKGSSLYYNKKAFVQHHRVHHTSPLAIAHSKFWESKARVFRDLIFGMFVTLSKSAVDVRCNRSSIVTAQMIHHHLRVHENIKDGKSLPYTVPPLKAILKGPDFVDCDPLQCS